VISSLARLGRPDGEKGTEVVDEYGEESDRIDDDEDDVVVVDDHSCLRLLLGEEQVAAVVLKGNIV
jgi:hypothetical protein